MPLSGLAIWSRWRCAARLAACAGARRCTAIARLAVSTTARPCHQTSPRAPHIQVTKHNFAESLPLVKQALAECQVSWPSSATQAHGLALVVCGMPTHSTHCSPPAISAFCCAVFCDRCVPAAGVGGAPAEQHCRCTQRMLCTGVAGLVLLVALQHPGTVSLALSPVVIDCDPTPRRLRDDGTVPGGAPLLVPRRPRGPLPRGKRRGTQQSPWHCMWLMLMACSR